MQTQSSFKLDPSSVAVRLGLCAAALAGAAAAPEANAAIVTFSTPIVIPATAVGVYINLLTGATGNSSALSGWDFNPYLSNGLTQLGFYWQTTAGGVATTATPATYIDLTAGTTISASSTFSRSINATSAFQIAGTHTLGFQFLNEATSAIDYGYMTITTGSAAGFPATITGWKFDNTGAAITIPAVPEPTSIALMSLGALALGAVNLRRARRQRRASVQ